MRKLIFLILSLVAICDARAEKSVTVDQLERVLAQAIRTNKPDQAIALQINRFELSEQLSEPTLERFVAILGPRSRAATALELLADQSAFLDPPARELPAIAIPDYASQHRMLDAAQIYVSRTMPNLPNFLATRTAINYDDSPRVLENNDWPVRAGLHMVGTSSREISVRNDNETAPYVSGSGSPQDRENRELSSWGEFGPMLVMIIADAVNGTVSWSHWELDAISPVAVFKYSVPKPFSHYVVAGTIDQHALMDVGPGGVFRAPQALVVSKATPYRITPGYHGTIWLEPATGTILKFSIEADLKDRDPVKRADALVKYGRVSINGQVFICPVRSLALHLDRIDGNDTSEAAPLLKLNETSFTNYHRFSSTSRILAIASTLTPENSSAEGAPLAPSGEYRSPEALDTPSTATNTTTAQSPEATSPHSDAPSEPEIPEIGVTMPENIPERLASLRIPIEEGSAVRSGLHRVDLSVIVFDKQGNPVNDLRSENFAVYDNRQKQSVQFFSNSIRNAVTLPTPSAEVGRGYSNSSEFLVTETSAMQAVESGTTILLIDHDDLSGSNTAQTRDQLLRFVDGLPAGERVGLYVRDHQEIQVIAEVNSEHEALRTALLGGTQGILSALPQQSASSLGPGGTLNSNSSDAATSTLSGLARHLSFFPGHKSLVWITSSGVLEIDQTQTVIGKDQKDTSFALTIADALNESHTSFYPLLISKTQNPAARSDAKVPHPDLDQLAQASVAEMANRDAAPQSRGALGDLTSENDTDRHLAPAPAGTSTALHEMQPIQKIAEATGGRRIELTGGLAKSLSSLAEEERGAYLIGFYPTTPADDRYHEIGIKLIGKAGLRLRYSLGYFHAKEDSEEPASQKERLLKAIWQPLDLSEIGINGDLVPVPKGKTLKLKVKVRDLALKVQDELSTGKLDVFLIEENNDGLHARMNIHTLDLKLKPTTYENMRQEGLDFDLFVKDEPNTGFVRVLVLDENSGRMGSITISAASLMAP